MTLPPPRTLGPLTRTDFVRYQGASGDMNPVHHDELFATNAGFPAPLAVGMYTAGALCAWASDHYGPRNVRRTRIRWKKPCFPGAVLAFSAALSEERDEAFELELTATDAEGSIAVQAWMTFAREPAP